MINISYNILSSLQDQLQRIEVLRRDILISPLPQKIEMRLRWEAKVERVLNSLLLGQISVTKSQVVKLLSRDSDHMVTTEESRILKYTKAFDLIANNWYVTGESVTPKLIDQLYEIACTGRQRTTDKEFRPLIEYLDRSNENPVIQAAIAYIEILRLNHYTSENDLLARLVAYLYLYKYGYDVRGVCALEQYWYENNNMYQEIVTTTLKTPNITYWITYFAKTMCSILEKVDLDIKTLTISWRTDLKDSFWKLSDRQKEIMNVLEKPDATITNRKVQTLFDISQITASRDLAKLSLLGLIFVHGRGRSVYYTRV